MRRNPATGRRARARPRAGRQQVRRPVSVDGVTIWSGPDEGAPLQLEEGIIAYNLAATGIDDAQPVTGVVRDFNGELLGGTHGWSWGGTCWIDSLWVREDRRGKGLGTALLRFAEREARARHCHQLALDTHTFQAPDFYLRHGFEIVGRLEGYPEGHARLVMRKLLDAQPDRPAG
jgi:ribosomal protein S18 acetylase RimI-like enzyme